jgi:hypothetical protein
VGKLCCFGEGGGRGGDDQVRYRKEAVSRRLIELGSRSLVEYIQVNSFAMRFASAVRFGRPFANFKMFPLQLPVAIRRICRSHVPAVALISNFRNFYPERSLFCACGHDHQCDHD